MNSNNLVFFTYFDSKFLIQGTVAVQSFLRENKGAKGIIYCTSQKATEILKWKFARDSVDVKLLSELPEIKKEIDTAKNANRNSTEVLISIKPLLILETLKVLSANEILLYIDADLFFYESIVTLLGEFDDCSILLSRHLFPPELSESVKYGVVNAGFIMLRNTPNTVALLMDWAMKCREWCFLRLENGKYADQLYLNDYLYHKEVKVISHPGVNNGMYYFQSRRKVRSEGRDTFIDNHKLVCFHFHGIRISNRYIQTGFNRYKLPKRPIIVWNKIYRRYIDEIRATCLLYKRAISSNWLQREVFVAPERTVISPVQRFRKTVVRAKT